MFTNNIKPLFPALCVLMILVSLLIYHEARANINELNEAIDSNQIQQGGASASTTSSSGTAASGAAAASSSSQAASAAAAEADNSGVVMGSYLNVRVEPWGTIIGRLKQGEKINILATEGDWYKIKYNGRDAYIHSGYIATKNKVSVAFCGYINTPGGCLNVRTGPWGTIIGKLSDSAKVEVLGREGDWYKIRYNGKDAYIYAKYAQKNKPAPSAASPSKPSPAPASTAKPSSGNAGLSAPLGGSFKVGSKFGMRFHPILKYNRMHYGVDIGKPTGTPLLAMGDGKVIYSGWCNGGGYMVKIKYNNGYTSTFMHCLPSGAKAVGTKVSAGQQVAKVNNTGMSTGSHLHLEITNPSGQRIDPQKVL
ncbi:MAG: hypothetical protein A2008_13000 [Candidatus Wallbacteria bacterium GWC2_49_35]|uniref:SH3b domain-containing protein n=1 Tax=Candidatus Wallbacteria bacterium GWC2_49_35 TaxID=1817813 RepID=A0A1F7WHC8_9BACT|nr:MAG: hypothetical protein A2008_13000 [Candidatus Wallbacteria bacterium GWC2_49_35]HBC75727.1 hypothetical protein [Candidatus Wallbacteria bacterium]